MELLDFLAYLLAILAGCSFISRMTKYFLERMKIFDQTSDSYAEFIDEKEKSEEAKSRNDQIANRPTKDFKVEMPTNNNLPDSLSHLNPTSNFDKKSDIVVKQ